MNTQQWQETKKAQGGEFTEAQRAELFGSRPVNAMSRDDMLVARLDAGLWLSRSDKRDARRLKRERAV